MAPCVAHQIPHHLIEVNPVKFDHCVSGGLEYNHVFRHSLSLQKVIHETRQERCNFNGLCLHAVSPGQLKHIAHHAVEAFGIVLNDAHQSVTARAVPLLNQQITGMGYR